jgi:hypothetical protein
MRDIIQNERNIKNKNIAMMNPKNNMVKPRAPIRKSKAATLSLVSRGRLSYLSNYLNPNSRILLFIL